jgi:hypothetical protein
VEEDNEDEDKKSIEKRKNIRRNGRYSEAVILK